MTSDIKYLLSLNTIFSVVPSGYRRLQSERTLDTRWVVEYEPAPTPDRSPSPPIPESSPTGNTTYNRRVLPEEKFRAASSNSSHSCYDEEHEEPGDPEA